MQNVIEFKLFSSNFFRSLCSTIIIALARPAAHLVSTMHKLPHPCCARELRGPLNCFVIRSCSIQRINSNICRPEIDPTVTEKLLNKLKLRFSLGHHQLPHKLTHSPHVKKGAGNGGGGGGRNTKDRPSFLPTRVFICESLCCSLHSFCGCPCS